MDRTVPMAAATGLLALALSGCAVFDSEAVQQAREEGISPTHILSLNGAAVGTRIDGEDLAVVLVYTDKDGELESTAIGSTKIVPGSNSFRFASGSGLGLAWNTFLYGSASPGVTRVSSSLPDARGGEVVDGVWVIASPLEGVAMGDLDVAFIDASGDVVDQQ